MLGFTVIYRCLDACSPQEKRMTPCLHRPIFQEYLVEQTGCLCLGFNSFVPPAILQCTCHIPHLTLSLSHFIPVLHDATSNFSCFFPTSTLFPLSCSLVSNLSSGHRFASVHTEAPWSSVSSQYPALHVPAPTRAGLLP